MNFLDLSFLLFASLSIQSFSTKKTLRVALQCHWTLGDPSKITPKSPGERKKQPPECHRFPKGIKLIPIGPWVKASRLVVDISRLVTAWFMVVDASENLGGFHIMEIWVGSEDAPLNAYRHFTSHPFNNLVSWRWPILKAVDVRLTKTSTCQMRFHLDKNKKHIKMLQLGNSSQKMLLQCPSSLPTSSKGFTPLHHAAEFGLEQVGGTKFGPGLAEISWGLKWRYQQKDTKKVQWLSWCIDQTSAKIPHNYCPELFGSWRMDYRNLETDSSFLLYKNAQNQGNPHKLNDFTLFVLLQLHFFWRGVPKSAKKFREAQPIIILYYWQDLWPVLVEPILLVVKVTQKTEWSFLNLPQFPM